MTTPTPILTLPFDIKVQFWELQYIRAAIANDVLSKKPIFDKAGHPTDFFHNHDEMDNRDGRTLNRFPFIQYTTKNDYLYIVAIGPAVPALLFYLTVAPESLQFRTRTEKFKPIKHYARLQHYQPYELEQPIKYTMLKWMGLQEKKHVQWKQMHRLTDKIPLLEEALIGSILRFLREGCAHYLEFTATATLYDIFIADEVTYKSRPWRCFTIEMYSNVCLPTDIGLGKGCSVGFGKLLAPKDIIHAVPVFPVSTKEVL